MEYVRTGLYYFACIPVALTPPAIWILARRKGQPLGPWTTIVLLHVSLLIFFFLARHDRWDVAGYGSLVNYFLFTPYFVAYPLLLTFLVLVHVRNWMFQSPIVVCVALVSGTIAYSANREFDWQVPHASRHITHYHGRETPLQSGLLVGGMTAAMGAVVVWLELKRQRQAPR